MQSALPIVVTSRSTLQERVALRLGPQVIDGRIPLSDLCALGSALRVKNVEITSCTFFGARSSPRRMEIH